MVWIKRLALAGVVVAALVFVAARFWFRNRFVPQQRIEAITTTLNDEISAVEAKTWPRPPLFDEPTTGTAWDHYLLAIDLILAAEDELSAADRLDAATALESFDDPERPIPESLQRLLRAIEPAWLEVRRGACASAAGRVFTPRNGFDGGVDLRIEPHEFGRHLTDLARARAALLAPDDPDQAIETLMILHRFGEDFAGGGMALSFIVGGMIRDEAVRMTGRLVTRNFLMFERVDRVLDWLDRIPDLPPDPLEFADTEVLYELRSIEKVAEAKEDTLTRQSHYRVLEYFRECFTRARKDMSDRGVTGIGEEYRRLLRERRSVLLVEGNAFASRLVDSYFAMTTIVFEKIDERMRRSRAVRAAVTLLIHAHRFKDAEGRYPATLPELLAAIPGRHPPTEGIVYRRLSDRGAVTFFWQPDLDEEEEEGRPARPLARTWPD